MVYAEPIFNNAFSAGNCKLAVELTSAEGSPTGIIVKRG
jgi:hypothetical protein